MQFLSSRLSRFIKFIPVSGLIVISFVSAFFVWPVGEFALNDDWAHTLSIYQFVENGTITYLDWLAPFNYIPIMYGGLIAKIVGFSFTSLRLLNVLFGIGAVIFLYLLLRFFKRSQTTSFLFALLLLFNPIFFNLSLTFMGDIPALTFMLAAIYFYLHGFTKEKSSLIFFGTVMAVAAFLTRQTMLALLIAPLIIILGKRRFHQFNFIIAALIPVLVGLMAVMYGYSHDFFPDQSTAHFLPEGWSYISFFIKSAWLYWGLLSLFTLPAIISFFGIANKRTQLGRILAIVAGVFLGLWNIFTNISIFDMGNIINRYGLGPNIQVLQGQLDYWWPSFAYDALQLTASVSGTLLIWFIIERWSKLKNAMSSEAWFILFFFTIPYFIFISLTRNFDRYILFLLPLIFIITALVYRDSMWRRVFFITIICLYADYSVIGTHNYFRWNDARWQAAEYLSQQQNIEKSKIDAGYEWVGWYLYQLDKPFNDFTPSWAPWYIKDLTPGHHMEYIVSFSPLGGYEVIRKIPVSGWWQNIDTIYINKVSPNSL